MALKIDSQSIQMVNPGLLDRTYHNLKVAVDFNTEEQQTAPTAQQQEMAGLLSKIKQQNQTAAQAANSQQTLDNTQTSLQNVLDMAQQATNTDLTANQRETLDQQIKQELAKIDENLQQTGYQAGTVLNATVAGKPISYQLPQVDTETLLPEQPNVETPRAARSSMGTLETALAFTNKASQQLGGFSQQASGSANLLQDKLEQSADAQPGLADIQATSQSAMYTASQMLSQAAVTMAAQANIVPNRALKLLEA